MTPRAIVVLALFSVVNIASRILAPLLTLARSSPAVSALSAVAIAWRFAYSNQVGAVMVAGSFGDLVDARFREIQAEDRELKRDRDMIPFLWSVTPPATPMRPDERYSEVSGLARAGQFTGSLDYAAFYQGYDATATYVEFGQGVQIERPLVEYDQFNIIDERARALFDSMWRRVQFDGQRFLRNLFSVDTFFYSHTEGVALASNSHTTTTGASTSAGFDNLAIAALSATAITSAQIQMRGFRALQAEPIQAVGDTLIIPIDLYETGYEIVASLGKVDTAQNNRNVHYGAYTLITLPNKVDFPDVNDWAMVDSTIWKRYAHWFYQVWPGGGPEFGSAEEFDTFIAKYRSYARYTNIIRKWQGILGSQVSG